MTDKPYSIDAPRREADQLDHVPVTYKGHTYLLPNELPVDVLDPFVVDEDFDLIGMLIGIAGKEGATEKDALTGDIFALLLQQPGLPRQVYVKIREALALLFGTEQWEHFAAKRPSIPDYGRLLKVIWQAYGVSLGEVFASPATSENGGTTPKQISPGSTPGSTSEVSGTNPVSPDS